MKATKHELESDFKPVKIVLEFTTQQELNAFRQLMFYNVSVPDHLFITDRIDVDTSKNMSEIMGQIMEVL